MQMNIACKLGLGRLVFAGDGYSRLQMVTAGGSGGAGNGADGGGVGQVAAADDDFAGTGGVAGGQVQMCELGSVFHINWGCSLQDSFIIAPIQNKSSPPRFTIKTPSGTLILCLFHITGLRHTTKIPRFFHHQKRLETYSLCTPLK